MPNPIASCSARSRARRMCSCSPATSPISASRRKRRSWRRICKACSIPVVGVLGNHDYECGAHEEVAHILRDAGMKLLDGQSLRDRRRRLRRREGICRRLRPAHARLVRRTGHQAVRRRDDERDDAARERDAQVRSKRSVVILHYAPVVDTIESEPLEIYPFLGSSRLAETIDRFKVSAIVHGHAHRGTLRGPHARRPAGLQRRPAIEKPTGKPYALIESDVQESVSMRSDPPPSISRVPDRSDCPAGNRARSPALRDR